MTRDELYKQVLNIVADSIRKVVDEDWIYEESISATTSFNNDIELESIEFIELAEKLQQYYGKSVDFVHWLEGKQYDEIKKLTVGDITEFIVQCQLSKQTI